jgi:hypothetical protein
VLDRGGECAHDPLVVIAAGEEPTVLALPTMLAPPPTAAAPHCRVATRLVAAPHAAAARVRVVFLRE